MARIEERWISEAIRQDPYEFASARSMFWILVIGGVSWLLFCVLFFWLRPEALAANSLLLVGHLVLCSSVLPLMWAKSVRIPGYIFCTLLVIQLSLAAIATGGTSSPLFALFPLCVVFMGYLLGLGTCVVCGVGLITASGVIWWMDAEGYKYLVVGMSSSVTYATLTWSIGIGVVVAWLHEQQTRRQRQRIEEELSVRRRTQSQLEEANINKDRFLAYLSHELRTPLTAILGGAELLERTGEDARQRRFITSLHGAAMDMARLLDDLLDLSRAEAGHLTLTLVPVELDELLAELREAYAPLMETRGLEWRVSCEDTTSHVLADPQRLTQVLRNLLNNAMKFTEEGRVTLSVTEVGEGRVRFAVSDTGIGIANDDLEAILEPYRQVEQTRKGGAGLGLPICSQLLACMDAQLEVESVPATGSTFSFNLLSTPSPSVQPSSSSFTPIEGMTVVVAEDNEAAGVVIEGLLTSLGCTVTRASDGAEAVAAVTAVNPAVALLDIQMPHMDGLQAARQLRASMVSGDISNCQLIALTGNLGARDTLRGEASFDGVLLKPVQREELLSCLQGQM